MSGQEVVLSVPAQVRNRALDDAASDCLTGVYRMELLVDGFVEDELKLLRMVRPSGFGLPLATDYYHGTGGRVSCDEPMYYKLTISSYTPGALVTVRLVDTEGLDTESSINDLGDTGDDGPSPEGASPLTSFTATAGESSVFLVWSLMRDVEVLMTRTIDGGSKENVYLGLATRNDSGHYSFTDNSIPPMWSVARYELGIKGRESLWRRTVEVVPIRQARLLEVITNPTAVSARLTFNGDSVGDRRVTIYDVHGSHIRTIDVYPNSQYIDWDLTDRHGIKVPAGTYLLHYTDAVNSAAEKVVVVR